MNIKLSIDQLLASYAVDTLVDIADFTQIAPRQKKRLLKVELLVSLKERLFHADRIQAGYAALDDDDRLVVNYLLFRGGEMGRNRLERDLVRAGVVTPAEEIKSTRYGDGPLYAAGERPAVATDRSRVIQDVLARLTRAGLVFSAIDNDDLGAYTYKLGLHPAAHIFIPASVRRHLPKVTASPFKIADWQPARTVHQSPHVLLRDLFLYWDYVRRVEPPLLRAGQVGKRTLRALNELLITPAQAIETAENENDLPRLRLLREQLMGLGLVVGRNGKLVNKDDNVATAFWGLNVAQQLGRLLQLRLRTASPVQRIYGATEWLPDLPKAQQEFLRTLLHNGAAWTDLEALIVDTGERDRNYLFPSLSKLAEERWLSAYFEGRYYSNARDLRTALDAAESTIALTFCNGDLFQFGLLEHGYLRAEDTNWRLVRLAEVGRVAVSEALSETPSAKKGPAKEQSAGYAAHDDQGRIVVQPNFQVLALGPVGTSSLAQLEMCATRVKADAHVFEYTLTRESIYRAQQAGTEVDVVIRFLETESAAPLPQNVLRSLEEWGAHHDRIVFRTGVTLLQAADAELLQRLLTVPAVEAKLARKVTPTIAFVMPDRATALTTALFAQGILPTSADADPSHTDNDVLVQPDGAITPVHAVPSIFLTGRLARIAELDTEGVWRLTPAAVQRHGQGREAVQALLNELGRLQRGSLPESVVADMKRWGGFYGKVGVATLTLLEFESKLHLADVCAHPALHEWLTVFPAGERALALAPSDRLAAIEAVLAELGVAIKRGIAVG